MRRVSSSPLPPQFVAAALDDSLRRRGSGRMATTRRRSPPAGVAPGDPARCLLSFRQASRRGPCHASCSQPAPQQGFDRWRPTPTTRQIGPTLPRVAGRSEPSRHPPHARQPRGAGVRRLQSHATTRHHRRISRPQALAAGLFRVAPPPLSRPHPRASTASFGAHGTAPAHRLDSLHPRPVPWTPPQAAPALSSHPNERGSPP